MTLQTSRPPCSDAAVKARTGRDWAGWCELLDREGAAAMPHADIAVLVSRFHSGGPWWSQCVTVGYERLRGRRKLFARSDGSFTATVSKTVQATQTKVFQLFAEARSRKKWAPPGPKLRSSTSPKTIRFASKEGGLIEVLLSERTKGKTVLAVEISGLSSVDALEQSKQVWRSSLEKLKHQLSA